VGRLIAFPRESPHGAVLVATPGDGGAPLGGVCCLRFGATGWIGALGVDHAARRGGVGTALTAAAIARLQDGGAQTVLLFATEMGRPLYERMGFKPEGAITAWSGTAGRVRTPRELVVRSLHEADRGALQALDRDATGEARDPVLGALTPLRGLAAHRRDSAVGWALASPWGAGVTACASDPDAGVALMAAAAAGPRAATFVVPDANTAAADALRRWGFARVAAGVRMRLGPPVAWHPECQFGLFNLFWG